MSNELLVQPQPDDVINPETCSACGSMVGSGDAFCSNCGYPLKGSEEEQQAFIQQRDYKILELGTMDKKIKSASNTIFILSAVFLLAGIVYFLISSKDQNQMVILIVNAILGIIYLGLGYWCKTQPAAAIISALVLYVIVQVLAMIDDPVNIIRGIFLKIIVIVYLVKGLNSALEAQRIKKELGV